METPSDYEPIVLPGESLAKYKNRAPGSSGLAGPLAAGAIPTEAEPATGSETAAEEFQAESTTIAESSMESIGGGAAARAFEAAPVEEAAPPPLEEDQVKLPLPSVLRKVPADWEEGQL